MVKEILNFKIIKQCSSDLQSLAFPLFYSFMKICYFYHENKQNSLFYIFCTNIVMNACFYIIYCCIKFYVCRMGRLTDPLGTQKIPGTGIRRCTCSIGPLKELKTSNRSHFKIFTAVKRLNFCIF